MGRCEGTGLKGVFIWWMVNHYFDRRDEIGVKSRPTPFFSPHNPSSVLNLKTQLLGGLEHHKNKKKKRKIKKKKKKKTPVQGERSRRGRRKKKKKGKACWSLGEFFAKQKPSARKSSTLFCVLFFYLLFSPLPFFLPLPSEPSFPLDKQIQTPKIGRPPA